MYPAQDHLIFLTVLITFTTFVLSLTQMLVFLSLYVMLSTGMYGRKFILCLFGQCTCLCAPYGIAGSTQELYACLFRQMGMLLLTISCFVHAAQPAMILSCPGSFN